MPATPEPPFHRWGVRFTADSTHDKEYLQDLLDNNSESMYRGELFINEPLDEVYYADTTGVVRRFGDRSTVPVSFSRINFTGLRAFADDVAAAAAVPPVPVGGMYRTGSILKVRVA
jgi:hypothetical protein